MSPIFTYRCGSHHLTDALRKMGERTAPLPCPVCGQATEPILTLPHVPPDGVYSYMPNLGDAKAYERKHEDAKERARRTA